MEKKEEVGSVSISEGVLRVKLIEGVIYQKLDDNGWFEYEDDDGTATIYSSTMFSHSSLQAILHRDALLAKEA